jgi:hypothetical protein
MLLTIVKVTKEILKNSLRESLRGVQGLSKDFLRKTCKPFRIRNGQSHGKQRKSLKLYRISADKSGRRRA